MAQPVLEYIFRRLPRSYRPHAKRITLCVLTANERSEQVAGPPLRPRTRPQPSPVASRPLRSRRRDDALGGPIRRSAQLEARTHTFGALGPLTAVPTEDLRHASSMPELAPTRLVRGPRLAGRAFPYAPRIRRLIEVRDDHARAAIATVDDTPELCVSSPALASRLSPSGRTQIETQRIQRCRISVGVSLLDQFE